MIVRVERSEVHGAVVVPSSKSHCIRALCIAALAQGESIIRNFLDSEDTRSCIRAVQILGARVEEFPEEGKLLVRGIGVNAQSKEGGAGAGVSADSSAGLDASREYHASLQTDNLPIASDIIDVGNSGTTLFFITSIAALSPQYSFFTGDGQIKKRSAENLLSALKQLGVSTLSYKGDGCAPFAVRGPMRSGTVDLACPVSQYLSSLMLTSPLLPKGSLVDIRISLLNERPYVEMTESWLKEQKIQFENSNFMRLRIPGGQRYTSFDKAISGDYSAATFFACAVAIAGGSITFKGLDSQDNQGDKQIFSILEEMGCTVVYRRNELSISAPLSGYLEGGAFDLNDIPDTLPALAITAAFARGETRLINVPQARLKETDRIACMAEVLGTLGVRVKELADGLVIHGAWPSGIPADVMGGTGAATGAKSARSAGARNAKAAGSANPAIALNGYGDHRICMACALAGLGASVPVEVQGAEAVAVTFPQFFTLLKQCTERENGSSPISIIEE